MRFPPEIERMMLEMHVEGQERRRSAVLADPVRHKLTREFPENARLNWQYWQVKGKRGKRVRYCYSTERNLAGYFLGWREVWDAKRGEGKRDMWIASKRRTTVRDKALQRKRAHEARLGRTQKQLLRESIHRRMHRKPDPSGSLERKVKSP